MARKVPWLDPKVPAFPDPESALEHPDGLLAGGGSLDPRFMLTAYSQAIFPWFSEGEPILWWSPSERAVIEPGRLPISRSFSKTLRNKPWTVSLDENFDRMVDLCASMPREGQDGTWISPQMREAYARLYRLGCAHSVEVSFEGSFCGGLFGVKLGGMFFGESMASMRPDASKVALAHLCLGAPLLGVELVDCQMMTPHLESMGASRWPRARLRAEVERLVLEAEAENWGGRLDGFDVKAAAAGREKAAGAERAADPRKAPPRP